MNLLEETILAIESNGHSENDIIFIGSESSGHQCSWEEYKRLADFEYDDRLGSVEVATDLILVFSNGSKLWRDKFGGGEWWEYSAAFVKPEFSRRIRSLSTNGMGDNLEDINI